MGLISAGDRCTPTLNLPELRIRKVYTKRKKKKLRTKPAEKKLFPGEISEKTAGIRRFFYAIKRFLSTVYTRYR